MAATKGSYSITPEHGLILSGDFLGIDGVGREKARAHGRRVVVVIVVGWC